jgi:FixJ family two-component response regulator
MSMTSPMVYVIEDDSRVAMSRLLRSYDYKVQSWTSVERFLGQQHVPGPACLVIDLKMHEMTGPDLLEVMSREYKSLPVILVSGEADIETSVQAMKAGAIDFLTKPIDERQLLSAIERGLAISKQAFAKQKEIERDQTAFVSLSPREQYVCLRIAYGLLNKQVGFELGTSEKTVKAQRSKMMQKLGAGSLPDIVRFVDRLQTAGGIPNFSANPPYRRGSAIPKVSELVSC